MSKFGLRVKASREAKGLSQTDLAAMIGVSPQAVQKWESGVNEARGHRLSTLAQALEVSKEFLKGEEAQREEPRAKSILTKSWNVVNELQSNIDICREKLDALEKMYNREMALLRDIAIHEIQLLVDKHGYELERVNETENGQDILLLIDPDSGTSGYLLLDLVDVEVGEDEVFPTLNFGPYEDSTYSLQGVILAAFEKGDFSLHFVPKEMLITRYRNRDEIGENQSPLFQVLVIPKEQLDAHGFDVEKILDNA
nr:hypothetical protein 11 [bacterium]